MIVPLYAHHSSPQWNTLYRQKTLKGAIVIINPNDGPIVSDKETKNWAKVAATLRGKGAEIAIYIDAFRARLRGGKWELEKKSRSELQDELAAAEKISQGYIFLDDFPEKGGNEIIASICGAIRRAGRQIIANQGTAGSRAYGDFAYIQYESNGMPKDTSRPFIALGVKSLPRGLKVGKFCYVTSAVESGNPYEKLPGYFEEMLKNQLSFWAKLVSFF